MDRHWEFMRLGGVSIKALRLYAELGLLRPAAVKPESRYRLYTCSQLPRLRRIMLLKRAGFALAEIRGQLSHREEASLEQIRARLVQRAGEIQRHLSWIDAGIRSSSQLVVKQVPRLAVWSRRQGIDSYDRADALLRDLVRDVPAAARLVSGTVWHDCGRRSGSIDCEVFWLSLRNARAATPGEPGPATVASSCTRASQPSFEAMKPPTAWVRDHRDNGQGRFRSAGPPGVR